MTWASGQTLLVTRSIPSTLPGKGDVRKTLFWCGVSGFGTCRCCSTKHCKLSLWKVVRDLGDQDYYDNVDIVSKQQINTTIHLAVEMPGK